MGREYNVGWLGKVSKQKQEFVDILAARMRDDPEKVAKTVVGALGRVSTLVFFDLLDKGAADTTNKAEFLLH